MTKFFEKLIDKFFDFFNFGRFITIIIPGLIMAICLAMLMSQIVFPLNTKASSTPSATAAAQKETAIPASDLFALRVAQDFHRVTSNFYYVLLFGIVLGLLVYEAGFRLILLFPEKDTYQLYQYQADTLGAYDSHGKQEHNFAEGAAKAGLVYFAPFLKEKFSGEENYFNFLITEYYRFLEFSVIMPISAAISGFLAICYYWYFCAMNACSPYHVLYVVIFFIVLFGLCVLYALMISRKVFEQYKAASKDLVRGVSEFMSKGLA